MTTTISPSILITGATGNIGSDLVKILAAKGVPFRAMVRSFENTDHLLAAGAELILGDMNDPSSITQAVQGIERAFLLTNSTEKAQQQQSNFVDVAKLAGVKHIVKLSQFAADENSPVRFLRYHAAVEQRIRQSGMTYTFLRPNLFMQGLLGFRELIIRNDQFFAAIADAKISLVDTRDIAAVAAEALLHDGHENKIYNLTGDEALTHDQLAARLSGAIGRHIKFIDVKPQEMRDAVIGAGFPQWQADGLVEDYAHYARGEAALIYDTIERVTGSKPRSFSAFARDYAFLFMQPATPPDQRSQVAIVMH